MSNQSDPIVTYEFGTLYIEGDPHNKGDFALKETTFNNLWNFILANNANGTADAVMSVHTRGGRKYITTTRYVGTIQTKDGKVIEILPKIYKVTGKQEEDKEACRDVFLNMLKHLTNAKARSFQNATLNTKKGFPILEVYISNYIESIEQLMRSGGLKKNYTQIEENQVFLKGKLLVSKQITRNVANNAHFYIRYNKYQEDIPQNRIIVATLRKLLNYSHNTTNKARISTILSLLDGIPTSINIENDLRIASSGNRLFESYDLLMKWSSQFLLNKGFTTFAGDYVNQSLLFKAEKLFEDFVAYLFKKYAASYKVDAQNVRYYLVDRHNGKSIFKLKPDIVVESDSNNPYECYIIDTKWKQIDSTKPDNNYLLEMKDLYQLYAYGQKYKLGELKVRDVSAPPKLALIYPCSEKFTTELPTFIYDVNDDDTGLRLLAVPFNLAEPQTYQQQVIDIIRKLKEC